jgi:hypothetical protein
VRCNGRFSDFTTKHKAQYWRTADVRISDIVRPWNATQKLLDSPNLPFAEIPLTVCRLSSGALLASGNRTTGRRSGFLIAAVRFNAPSYAVNTSH